MNIATLGRLAGPIVVLAGLVYGPGSGAASAAKPPRPATTTPVPLRVTILETDSLGNQCRICSDQGGDYVDGEDAVNAQLDRYGNVIIDFGINGNRFREMTFDFALPVDLGNAGQPPAIRTDSYLSTQTHPEGLIQLMAIGAEQCLQSNLSFYGNGTMYRLHFRRPLNGDFILDTSYLVVTRVGDDTWELEPREAGCNDGVPTRAKLFTNGTEWYMPFKMILRRR